VGHLWYYEALRKLLTKCTNLERLAYKGSVPPIEIVQRLATACPSATTNFVEAKATTMDSNLHQDELEFMTECMPCV